MITSAYREMIIEELVVLVQNRNQVAFNELVRRKTSFIRYALCKSLPDDTNYEDLAQEVLVRVWKHIPRLENPMMDD